MFLPSQVFFLEKKYGHTATTSIATYTSYVDNRMIAQTQEGYVEQNYVRVQTQDHYDEQSAP